MGNETVSNFFDTVSFFYLFSCISANIVLYCKANFLNALRHETSF